jgi:hypothetical protein
MLPRPATIAAPPTTASPASWNPAVPPPPVTGAAVGTGLNEGLGDGLAEGLGLGDADGLGEELALTLVDALAEVVATLPAPVPVTVTLTVTPSLTVGDRVVTGGVEGLEVQAESATQASMVVRPQPTTVSRTRCDVPAMAVRALIEPPRVLGNDHFPVAGRRNEENVGDLNVKPKR